MTETQAPQKAKRGREIFRERVPPARPSKPPEDLAIRDVQSRHHPWGEKRPSEGDEEDADR